MDQITFSIQNRHTLSTGIADVVDSISEGKVSAAMYFTEFVKSEATGYYSCFGKSYTIYANYLDSGSEDYYYFAILN